MATKMKHFSKTRHPEVFEEVYLRGTSGGSLASTPIGYVYRNNSLAIEDLACELLRKDEL